VMMSIHSDHITQERVFKDKMLRFNARSLMLRVAIIEDIVLVVIMVIPLR
jgi:Kef-type K+ transport system membrane component KefB